MPDKKTSKKPAKNQSGKATDKTEPKTMPEQALESIKNNPSRLRKFLPIIVLVSLTAGLSLAYKVANRQPQLVVASIPAKQQKAKVLAVANTNTANLGVPTPGDSANMAILTDHSAQATSATPAVSISPTTQPSASPSVTPAAPNDTTGQTGSTVSDPVNEEPTPKPATQPLLQDTLVTITGVVTQTLGHIALQ